MPTPWLTADELIATANHTETPIVFVEGKTDASILRRLETLIGLNGCLMVCGGRSVMFSIVERRDEIRRARIAFLADQDLFCIFGGHKVHPDLHYTWGYSIENDLIAGSSINKLLTAEEEAYFDALRLLATKWFSSELEDAQNNNRGPVLDVNLEGLIDAKNKCVRRHLPQCEAIESCNTKLQRRINRGYKRLLRGKQLIQLYVLVLGRKGRPSRFTGTTLVDVCTTQGSNRRLGSLAKRLRASLE